MQDQAATQAQMHRSCAAQDQHSRQGRARGSLPGTGPDRPKTRMVSGAVEEPTRAWARGALTLEGREPAAAHSLLTWEKGPTGARVTVARMRRMDCDLVPAHVRRDLVPVKCAGRGHDAASCTDDMGTE